MEKFIKAKTLYPLIAGILPSRFESESDAFNENNIRIRVLGNFNSERAALLAEKLSDCDVNDTCFSFACAECVRRFRVKKINQLVNLCKDHKECSIVTIIYYDEMIPSLLNVNIARIKGRLRKQLSRAGIADSMIGLFETDYHAEYKAWLPHFHLLVADARQNSPEWLNFTQSHKKQQQKASYYIKIKRPVMFQTLENPSRQIAYLYKVMWQQVEAFYHEERRFTKKHRLTTNRFVRSLLKLDSLKLSDLEFMYGIRQYGSTVWRWYSPDSCPQKGVVIRLQTG